MMMMNKRRKRYSSLGSIAEVRKEREKLDRMIKANDSYLKEDWTDISYWFSPLNIMNEAVCRVSSASSLIANIVAGARTAIKMIREHLSVKSE
jgi:hypothetical protein